MIKFAVHGNSSNAFAKRINARMDDKLRDTLDTVKEDWQQEVVAQQKRLQGSWRPLTEKYRNSRQKRESSHPNEKLKLTGTMMRKYAGTSRRGQANAGTIYPSFGEVELAFPINTPARIHQADGYEHNRQFELQPFKDIAAKRFKELIEKVINE